MTDSIDQYIEKYLEYKNKYTEIDKKVEKYKKEIKSFLKKSKLEKYDNAQASVTLQIAKKSTIAKKNTPSEIWEKYSKETNYEILNVKKKN